MAKIIRKKARKSTPKRITQTKGKIQNGIFSKIKFTESYTSLLLGAIAVVIVGILVLSFAKINRNTQTSSVMDAPKTWEEISQYSNTSSTYTIRPGDDLWTISENLYNDGYKWVEIAELNKLENPGMINAGDKLTIPTVISTITQGNPELQREEQDSQMQNTAIQNNSITRDTYVVVSGDNLWDIAVRAYGDGFKWPEIARANSLSNPNLIFPGNIFQIPR